MPAAITLTKDQDKLHKEGLCICGCGAKAAEETSGYGWGPKRYGLYATPACRSRAFRQRKARPDGGYVPADVRRKAAAAADAVSELRTLTQGAPFERAADTADAVRRSLPRVLSAVKEAGGDVSAIENEAAAVVKRVEELLVRCREAARAIGANIDASRLDRHQPPLFAEPTTDAPVAKPPAKAKAKPVAKAKAKPVAKANPAAKAKAKPAAKAKRVSR